MRFLDFWQMPSKDGYLLFQAPALKTFDRYRQTTWYSTEAGGVLLGYVRGEHLDIVFATPPQARDVRRRTGYERNDSAHQAIADRMWQESSGEIRYLGEWHTHPEDSPSPSSVDIDGWRQRASARQDTRATLGVIVGRVGLYVSLVDKGGHVEACNIAVVQ